MKQRQENHHMVDILFVLTLFCTFTVSALMLVNIGAHVYQQTVKSMDDNFSTRTVFAYLTEKIRQNDNSGALEPGTLEGSPALIIHQDMQNAAYVTYLYADEGYLKELLITEGADIGGSMKSAGQKIIEIQDFSLEQMDSHLYRFRLTDCNRESLTLYIGTHSR